MQYSVALTFLVAICTVSSAARGYTTESQFSDRCHERITFDALRMVRDVLPTADSVPSTKNEDALIDDVPFTVDDDLRDLSAVTLALANRDVDLRGHEPEDLDELAPLHGAPERQDEHCLRAPDDDEPNGSELALQACRAVIRAKVDSALQGLTSGIVDADERLELKVVLDIRGAVDANLPRFQVEMGRAMHTLQDGFSHAFRTDQFRRVTAVLNYVDFVEERLEETRDGPPHRSGLDDCLNVDRAREQRLNVATTASAELMIAALDPDNADRQSAVDDVLTNYLSFEPGCTAENDWCDAPEQRYDLTRGCLCRFVGPDTGARHGSFAVAALLVLSLCARRRFRTW